jgi:hypothetical protein
MYLEVKMQQSESIANLAKALSTVQGKLTHAKKDSANPFFKSKYADLESVWDACRDLLASNGLAVAQFPGLYSELDKSMSLTTILTHNSGEWISQEMSMPLSKVDAHGCMAILTYMRRASLAAVIGVVQADDDGNTAVNKSQPVVKAKEI